ncbi:MULTISPECIES: hypothetical protein [unclassified Luteococcus]|uniref:hypothetical protein n=1 Tax=unclassified Luteococcus TaxID=2639923 RepID=UPI00313BCD4E
MRGFLVVLLVGLVLLALAAWRDRQTRRIAEGRLGAPLESLTPPSPSDPDAGQREALESFRASQPRYDAVLADQRFASWAKPPTAEAAQVDLLCCPEGVGSLRELLPSLQKARASHRGLVLVCPGFDEDLLTHLVTTGGPARPVPLLASPQTCRELADLTGATPADRTDLQSGAAPRLHGTARRVVADATGCWLDASLGEPPA